MSLFQFFSQTSIEVFTSVLFSKFLISKINNNCCLNIKFYVYIKIKLFWLPDRSKTDTLDAKTCESTKLQWKLWKNQGNTVESCFFQPEFPLKLCCLSIKCYDLDVNRQLIKMLQNVTLYNFFINLTIYSAIMV